MPISGRCRTPTGPTCRSCSSPRGGTRARSRFRSATALRSSSCVSIRRSTGRVSLSGPDPLAEPLIDPALGSDEADLRTLLRGLEDGANDLRARELQAVPRARGVARRRGLVRRAMARAHQAHAHDRPPSGLDVPHGAGRRQRRRPRAQGARARAAQGRRCLDLSAPRGREHERERRGDRGEGVRHDLGQAAPPAPHRTSVNGRSSRPTRAAIGKRT